MTLRHFFKTSTKMAIATGFAAIALTLPTRITTAQAQGNPLLEESNDLPLSVTFGELDSSWRKIRTAGASEFGDLMQAWSTMFGLSTFSNVYYTQGKTVKMAGNTYLVVYRFPIQESSITLDEMFSGWDWDSQCDVASMMETGIGLESPLSLSLLNPITIGSLNDIQPVDVAVEIQRSQADLETKVAVCQEQAAGDSAYEAELNMGSLNRGQQAFYLETGTFTTNVEDLGIGLKPETEFYRYSAAVRSPNLVITQALSKLEQGYHYVGGVAVVEDSQGSPMTITVLCESEAIAEEMPKPPIFDAATGMLSCPANSYELY